MLISPFSKVSKLIINVHSLTNRATCDKRESYGNRSMAGLKREPVREIEV